MLSIKEILKSYSVIIIAFCAAAVCVLFAGIGMDLKPLVAGIQDPKALDVVKANLNMNTMIVTVTALILGLTAIVTLVFSIGRLIEDRQANMGVLKALGYRNVSIAKHYAKFGLNVLIGTLAGFLISYLLTPPVFELMYRNHNLPPVVHRFHFQLLLLCVLAPSALFTAVAFLYAWKKLKKQPLAMILGSQNVKVNRLIQRTQSKGGDKGFLKTLARSVFLSRAAIIFFVCFAGLVFGAEMQMAFTVQDFTNRVEKVTFKGIAYESNVRLIEPSLLDQNDRQIPYSAFPCRLEFSEETLKDSELIALSDSQSLLKLYTRKGKAIDVNETDGIVINEWISTRYGLKKGDLVKVRLGNSDVQVPVAEIESALFGNTVYCNFSFAVKAGITGAVSHNGFYSSDIVAFDPVRHLSVTTPEDIRREAAKDEDANLYMSSIFIILGLLMGITTLQIALSFVIKNNSKYFSLMKAFGYTDRERSGAVLWRYRVAGYLGFLLGTGYFVLIFKIVFDMMNRSGVMVIPAQFGLIPFLLSLAIFLLIFEAILYLYKRKINRIPLKEIMQA